MEREMKFRAFVGENLVYSDSINTILINENDKLKYFFMSLPPICKLMQFTGLKDKNGIDIYELDILDNGFMIKWNQLHNCFGYFNYNHQFVREILSDIHDSKGNISHYHINACIVGNFYSNPEL